MRTTRILALAAATALTLAACAPADDADSPAADDGTPATLTEGVLTIGTSDPSYEPWVVDNDPTNGEGFESAVAYAVAAQLGFSSSYYDTAQAVVTVEGSTAAEATTLVELADLRIGAMVATTSAQVAQDSIAPSTDVQLFNDNDQVKQALTSGLVDAIVVDLPTALYITAAELDGGILVGQLPTGDAPDQFGLVLDKGSPLTDAVTTAVDALRADGTLADLEAEWLTDAAGAPVLG